MGTVRSLLSVYVRGDSVPNRGSFFDIADDLEGIGDSDEAEGNHVHEQFLMKGSGGAAMPGGGADGVLKIPIEGLDVPSHVIDVGQFRGRKQGGIEEGSD